MVPWPMSRTATAKNRVRCWARPIPRCTDWLHNLARRRPRSGTMRAVGQHCARRRRADTAAANKGASRDAVILGKPTASFRRKTCDCISASSASQAAAGTRDRLDTRLWRCWLHRRACGKLQPAGDETKYLLTLIGFRIGRELNPFLSVQRAWIAASRCYGRTTTGSFAGHCVMPPIAPTR